MAKADVSLYSNRVLDGQLRLNPTGEFKMQLEAEKKKRIKRDK